LENRRQHSPGCLLAINPEGAADTVRALCERKKSDKNISPRLTDAADPRAHGHTKKREKRGNSTPPETGNVFWGHVCPAQLKIETRKGVNGGRVRTSDIDRNDFAPDLTDFGKAKRTTRSNSTSGCIVQGQRTRQGVSFTAPAKRGRRGVVTKVRVGTPGNNTRQKVQSCVARRAIRKTSDSCKTPERGGTRKRRINRSPAVKKRDT